MNKTIAYILFFSFTFLFAFYLVDNVKADTTYSLDFEDDCLTCQLDEQYHSWINSTLNDNPFYVDNNNPLTGSKNFYITQIYSGCPCVKVNGWWTYFYSESEYMTNWSAMMRANNGYTTDKKYLIDFYDSDETLIIRLFQTRSSGSNIWGYRAHNGSYMNIITGHDTVNYLNISWEFVDNETVTYYFDETEYTGTPYGLVSNPRINKTQFMALESQCSFYCDIDDVNVTFSGSVGGGSTYYDFSEYGKYCEGEKTGQSTSFADSKYVENKFNINLNIKIEAVDLIISNNQYAQVSSDPADYGLYINGNGNYIATEIIESDYGDYRVIWDNVDLNINEQPIFSFSCSQYVTYGSTNYYWYGIGIDSIGGELKYHNAIYQHANNEYDGYHHNYGLDMCFYYSQPQPDIPTFDDSIEVIPKGKNTFYEWENVMFQYSVSAIAPDNYAQLYKDGVKFSEQNFDNDGFLLSGYSGTFSFLPTSNANGSWEVRLMRGGAMKDNDTFTVINLPNEEDYNAQIGTYPNPSELNEIFTIEWLYNYSYFSLKGAIAYTTTNYFGSDYYILKTNILNDGIMTHSFNEEGKYYIWLCTFEDGNITPVIPCSHYVGSFYDNEIRTDKTHYVMEYNPQFSFYEQVALVNITGSHSFLGGDVYVLINDGAELEIYVGAYNSIDILHVIVEDGYYEVKLVADLGESDYTLLAQTNFTVTKSDIEPLTETEEITQYFIGLIIILIFTFIGFGIANNLNSDSVLAIGLFFGFIGAIITILFDILPMWIMFMIGLFFSAWIVYRLTATG